MNLLRCYFVPVNINTTACECNLAGLDQAEDYGLNDGGDYPGQDEHEGAVKQSLKLGC